MGLVDVNKLIGRLDYLPYEQEQHLKKVANSLSDRNRNKRGRGKKTLLKVTYQTLEDLYQISKSTLMNHIKSGVLNPSDLKSIIEFYCTR